MVYSMTGYGKGNLVLNGRDITVEVKSVNHRYFEYTGRMSRAYSFLDDKIKKEVQSMISRGKVEVSLMINYTQKSDTRITADIPLVKSYYEALQSIAYSLDITVDNVVKALGVVNYQEFLTLFENTWLQEKPAVIEQIEKIYMSGKDLKLFMKSYYYFLVDLVCFNVTKNITLAGIPEFLEKDCKCSGDKLNFAYESMEKVGELINNIKWEQNAKPFIIARMITL